MAELEVQGQVVDSINEWNVAQALDKLNLDYKYQYYFGLIGVRGSQSIDFLVFQPPKPVPLFVHGEYWHSGTKAMEDKLKMAEITSRMKGTWAVPVVIWEHECETVESALQAVKEKLGV